MPSITITKNSLNKPQVALTGAAAERLRVIGAQQVLVSIADEVDSVVCICYCAIVAFSQRASRTLFFMSKQQYPTIESTIGHTPLVRLQRMLVNPNSVVLANSRVTIRRARLRIGRR